MSADGYTPLLPSDYEFVLRRNGAGGQIQYANLSCCIPDLSVLSATTISGDNNVVPTLQRSIDTTSNENGRFHQLYGFDNPTVFPVTQLSVGGLQFVLRDTTNGLYKQIAYSDTSSIFKIQGDGISGDVNVYPFMEKSIETLSGELGKFHRLYNWMGYSADQSHVISAAFGETRYFPFQDGTGTATDLANAAHILTRPRAGARDLHYDAYGIRIPKVSPTDVTQELYDLILSSGGGTDVSAVR